jgi:hypothetical protein
MRTDPEEPERRTARAKRGTMSPRPPKWFVWERLFPSDYKCNRENPVVRLDFPVCICSPMEKRVPTRTIGRGFENASGLGFWTTHPLHHTHMVNRQRHVRPDHVSPEPEEPERRTALAKRGTMSPRPPKWFLWELVFPSDYKCNRKNRAGQLASCPARFLTSCPARFSRLHL